MVADAGQVEEPHLMFRQLSRSVELSRLPLAACGIVFVEIGSGPVLFARQVPRHGLRSLRADPMLGRLEDRLALERPVGLAGRIGRDRIPHLAAGIGVFQHGQTHSPDAAHHEQLIAAHPDLQPELAEQLKYLSLLLRLPEFASPGALAADLDHAPEESDGATCGADQKMTTRCPACLATVACRPDAERQSRLTVAWHERQRTTPDVDAADCRATLAEIRMRQGRFVDAERECRLALISRWRL